MKSKDVILNPLSMKQRGNRNEQGTVRSNNADYMQ